MKMVKNGIRKILIAFIIVVVSFQSSFVGKAAEEPTIIDSGYSIFGNTLKLNDAGYMSDIIGVSVNDKEYTKVDKKSDLIASEKYALLEDGNIGISSLKENDVVTIHFSSGDLKVTIKNPQSFFGIYDKSSVIFTKKNQETPKENTPEEEKPQPETTPKPEDNKVDLKLKDTYFLGQFEIQIEPQEYVNDITKLQIDGVDQQEKENKYQAFNGGFYLDKTNYKIIMNEPNDGAKLSLTMKDGKVYQYQYNKSTNKVGERLVLQNENSTKPVETPTPTPDTKKQPEENSQVVKLTDVSSFGDYKISVEPKEVINQITKIQINHAVQEEKTSKWLAFNGGYYLDKNNHAIIMNEPGDDALVSVTLKNGKVYHFKYVKSNKAGTRFVAQKDEEVNSTKILKVRIIGSFEGAIQGQKKYDAISGASTSTSVNKNSNVQVQAAEVESEDAIVPESAWKPLSQMKNLYADRKQFTIELSPESGMKAVYNVYDSSITLSGTPNKIGKYPVKVNVKDAAGRTASSNVLYFQVYGTNEKLEDHLKVENARKMKDGKYIWDMNPWVITEFTHDASQTVTVPKDIKAWYGSNTTGVYGKLGQAIEQGGQIKHTLVIPSGANLTMVNMIVNSSVRIVVEDGAKLNLKDTSIYGEIVVKKGGTFKMNHEVDHLGNAKFLTGAMINGQLILEDGATLEDSKIYSNANFLTDGNKAKKIDTPVVVAKGNVTIKGQVYIRGDESATGEYNGKKVGGQPALRIENGTVNVTENSTLGVYGGGRFATTSIGGNALELSNGEVTGKGKLVAIGGASTWGDAGNAVVGTGKITVKYAILNGGNAYGKGSTPGKSHEKGVELFDTTIGKATDGKVLTVSSENDQPLYWKSITDEVPSADAYFGTEKISGNKKPETEKPMNPSKPEKKPAILHINSVEANLELNNVEKYEAYDIYFADEAGNEITVDEKKQVRVSLKTMSSEGVEIYHRKHDGSLEKIDVESTDGNEITFSHDKFSVYYFVKMKSAQIPSTQSQQESHRQVSSVKTSDSTSITSFALLFVAGLAMTLYLFKTRLQKH